MSSVTPNSDVAFLQLSHNFFKEPEDCPFCIQKAHLINSIQGLSLNDHTHDPFLCINNWVALIVIADNETSVLTPKKLQEYVDKMVFKIIKDVKKSKEGMTT